MLEGKPQERLSSRSVRNGGWGNEKSEWRTASRGSRSEDVVVSSKEVRAPNYLPHGKIIKSRMLKVEMRERGSDPVGAIATDPDSVRSQPFLRRIVVLPSESSFL